MQVYCKNYKCKWIRFLDEPIRFRYRKNYYIPFEDDFCMGECRKENLCINSIDIETRNIYYRYAVCVDFEDDESGIVCFRIDCIHNDKSLETRGFCERDEILIDRIKLYSSNEEISACKCFSQRKISGHKDWLGQMYPVPGGHLDDNYAEKLHKDSKKNRSYRTHFKEGEN